METRCLVLVLTSTLILDTEGLIATFGIDLDESLYIDAIYFFASGSATLDFYVDLEDEAVIEASSHVKANRARVSTPAANTLNKIDFIDGLNVVDRLRFVPSAETWTLTVLYDTRKGSMNFQAEDAEHLRDLKQVGGQMGGASAGKEFYQVGNRRKRL